MDSGMNSGTQSLLGEGILRDLLMSDRGPDRVPDVPLTVDKESSFNLSLNCTSDYVDTFQIDINSIKSVPKENQASELQELGVSVYDQETLEKGIIQQLDDAIEREKLEKVKKKYDLQIKSVQEDITSIEKEILNNETSLKNLPIKDTLSDYNEALLLRRKIDQGLSKISILQAKEKNLRQKRDQSTLSTSENDAAKENSAQSDACNYGVELSSDNDCGLLEENVETEQQKMIRLGQMTPFGTILSGPEPMTQSNKAMLGSINRYLESQANLSNKFKKSLASKKLTLTSKQDLNKPGPSGLELSVENGKKCINKSEALKINVLHPKRKRRRPNLGTETEFVHHKVKPGPLPSEVMAMNLESSGSEYVPSEFEESGEEMPKIKLKPQRKIQKKKSNGEEWHTDDSDWEYSDDESTRSRRKRRKKVIDDGNLEDYLDRIKDWEKDNKARQKHKQKSKMCQGLQDDIEREIDDEFQELDGGLKIPSEVWDKLFSYQKVGVQWMWELHQKKCGGILGDEMGLGKTIQIIAFFAGLASSSHKSSLTGWPKGLGPSLIVCPATMLHQWVKEFHEWYPPLRIAIMHDSGSFSGKGGKAALVKSVRASAGVVVTSYEGLSRQADELSVLDWHVVVLDEGHAIRNPDARVTLAAKRLRTPHRLLLSGSPLQNNLRELWSLFDFIYPGKLGTLPVFTAEFAVPITQGGYATASQVQVITGYKCATVLKDTIAPYLLRRMKNDVKDHINLPTKNEQVLFCRLTDEQREVYREYIKSGDVDRILSGTLKIFVGLINLRKICNHPHLYTGGPKLFKWDNEDVIPEEECYGYWKKSGKMIVVENLLRIWHRQGHRVLLFTQGRQMMCILENFLIKQGYTYLKLDGSTSVGARQPLINEFNKNPSHFVFLLTTRVGGLGVNLTGANRVLIYDPDWNPATDTQARERAWRPGQQRHVTVYRLVTAGTIEEKIYHRQIFKQFLTDRVLRDPKRRRFFKSNDLYELFTLQEDGDDLGRRGAKTETSAIFAGTGSEIHVSSSPSAKKRKSDSNISKQNISIEKRKLNEHQKGKSLRSTSEKCASPLQRINPISMSSGMKVGIESPSNEKNLGKEKDQDNNNTVTFSNVKSVENCQDSDKVVTFSKEKIEMMKKLAQNLSEKIGQQMKKSQAGTSNKNSNQEAGLLSRHSSGSKEKVGKACIKKKLIVPDDKDIQHQSECKRGNGDYVKKKKKHKHKRKDCVFEGEKVAHLVSVGEPSSKSSAADEEDNEELNQSQDDYVLKKLFSNSGLQTALRHDVIMDGGDADYALVEGEAERVAHEAVKALKESRRNCWAAGSGIPTWTGQNGNICRNPTAPSMGGRAKPLRFGKKKSQFSLGGSPQKSHMEPTTSSGVLSSQELLLHVRSKESLLEYFRWKKRMKERGENEDTEINEEYNGTSTGVSRDQADLLDDIRAFVACGASQDGKATTSEILARFQNRLPASATPQLFKSMLKSICDFHNHGTTGLGLWKLKPEFCD
ncbi:DNA excision repair protein ERCC-6-like [Ischnura elegans]|uniref:DNA excision repair protein ERCC-6-like n=1 Tax=Ischnura elegans TaxID=197161 RepID=UPI001ED8B709|nr:DNA excision repair protein ERCC-6-like [Ischnura elegans]